ncbi:homoprotocatechuate degradation operon regulator HpaR [Noviherbaspirillum denitrificans]|uniref:MarR family transcriptional regulator n=1 Tax=Noviherbaspirillum denitrificans TaxID=1968433 RepID=A0A254TCP7_9BURK|nr:homoprotocatechuate degradation operon regulator HpaR [Noviherbaspirillum denitrificans]OWW18333.1 MarR family transcriptional regulator [Noviherbaspirillum denitrificans]
MENADNRKKNRIAYRNLPQLLLKARDRLMSHFRPILNQFGLTEQQWRILRVLDEHGQLEPWELCEMCQILSPSMAGVLARMEETGLVHRARMAEDQRRVIVRLAPKGDQLLTEMAPLIDAQYLQIESAYGKRVFDDLFKALEDFLDADSKRSPQADLPARAKAEPRKGGRR